MARVLRTPEARRDLVEIAAYIEGENPAAADRLLDQIEEKLRLLGEFPEMGAPREELRARLRSFPIGKYLIFYFPIADGIEVIRVVHGGRNLRRIFRRRRTP